jgi:hypothetical protein
MDGDENNHQANYGDFEHRYPSALSGCLETVAKGEVWPRQAVSQPAPSPLPLELKKILMNFLGDAKAKKENQLLIGVWRENIRVAQDHLDVCGSRPAGAIMSIE